MDRRETSGHADDDHDYIKLSDAWRMVKADYLSEKHATLLICDALREGLLNARGRVSKSLDWVRLPSFFQVERREDGKSLAEKEVEHSDLEHIPARFWFTALHNGKSASLTANRIRRYPDWDGSPEPWVEDDDFFTEQEIKEANQEGYVAEYSDVYIDKDALIKLLSLPALQAPYIMEGVGAIKRATSQKNPGGRPKSEYWPEWTALAIRAAYKHKIHPNLTAHGIKQFMAQYEQPNGTQLISDAAVDSQVNLIVEKLKKIRHKLV